MPDEKTQDEQNPPKTQVYVKGDFGRLKKASLYKRGLIFSRVLIDDGFRDVKLKYVPNRNIVSEKQGKRMIEELKRT
jgi:hypothetical protein